MRSFSVEFQDFAQLLQRPRLPRFRLVDRLLLQLVTMNSSRFSNVKIPSSFSWVAVALMVVTLDGALPDAAEAAGAALASPIDKAFSVCLVLGFNPRSLSLKPTRGTPESKKKYRCHFCLFK